MSLYPLPGWPDYDDDSVDDHECVFGDACPYGDPDDDYIDAP
jgi:hypothetical protein